MGELRWLLIAVCVLASCSKANEEPEPVLGTPGTSTATGGAGTSAGAIGGTNPGGASATGTAGASSLNPPLCPWDSGGFVPSTPHTPCENEGEQCRLSPHGDCILPSCDFQLCDVTVKGGGALSYGVFYRSVCKEGFWETESSGSCTAEEDVICDCPAPQDSALPDEAWLTSTLAQNVGACVPRDTLTIGSEAGTPVVDGVMGAHVSCTVQETPPGFSIKAEIDSEAHYQHLNSLEQSLYTQQFQLEATVNRDKTGTAIITSTDSMSQTTKTFTSCTVTARSIVVGAMVADFSCSPGLNPDPADAGCLFHGVLDLKNCAIGDSPIPLDGGAADAGDATE